MSTTLQVFVSSVQKELEDERLVIRNRQRDMARRLAAGEELASRMCQELYGLSPQAVYKDFQKLVELGIARQLGSGRAARYGYHPHD